jgi:hypothetical protein
LPGGDAGAALESFESVRPSGLTDERGICDSRIRMIGRAIDEVMKLDEAAGNGN